ncbi:nucleolin [Anopheles nili]|uniref:nucleolin n=1 Tax=Anopheles nili TaxID=185578 RepID=UPI00237B14ED|nr:nucleolin [Anopheles nili]
MSKTPTKRELQAEIQKILKNANLEETAAKKVRLQLEQNLKCNLSSRKKEVDDLVMEYVNSQASSGGEDEEEEEDEDEDNGKATRRSKAKANSDYDDEEEEDDDDDDDEDFSEEEAPKGRKSAGKRGPPAKRGPPRKKKKASSDSDDEEEGSDEDYKPQKPAKGAGKRGRKAKNASDSDSDGKPAKKKAAGAKKPGARGNGYTRPYTLSADLAALCGAESLPRHEVVKKIWSIIKERNLYDPKNKQFAICDADLLKVIGIKRFRTFGMLKYLKPHFID